MEIFSRVVNADALYGPDLAYIHAAAFGKLAEGAAPEIMRLLESSTVPIRSVVDVGCGAGPLAAVLVRAGFEVTGIDISGELLSIARRAVPTGRFIQGSIYEMHLPPCQAIVAVGEPLSYHKENTEADAIVNDFFRRASQALPTGGRLIFDVIELGEPSLNNRYWNSGEDWAVLAETTEDQNSRTLVRNIETFRATGDLYRRNRETHHVRLFATSELIQQLTACGFSVETATSYGAQQLAPRRRAFICTRISGAIIC